MFFQRRDTTRSLVSTPPTLPRGSFATFCAPAQRKQSAIRRSSPSKNLIDVNRRRSLPFLAESSIDFFGQPQWIVAVIFGTDVRVPTWRWPS